MENEQSLKGLSIGELWGGLKYNLVFKTPIAGTSGYGLAEDTRARLEKAIQEEHKEAFEQELRRFQATRGEVVLVGDEVPTNDYPADTLSVGGRFFRLPDLETSRKLNPMLEELQRRIS